MKVLVPDASIILKWLLPGPEEEDSDRALQIRDAFVLGKNSLHVPSLWYFEVGNTLARKFPEYAEPLLETVMDLSMEENSIRLETLKTTLALTQRFDVTFYDASYHAVAINRGGTFITADRKYFSKAKAAGSIVLLQDWPADGL
jgi:predicted nucleic acid-binding protein